MVLRKNGENTGYKDIRFLGTSSTTGSGATLILVTTPGKLPGKMISNTKN